MTLRHLSLLICAIAMGLCAAAQPCNIPVSATVTPLVICSGRPFTLSSTFIPGARYSWTGPSGFSSTSQNPVIPSASFLTSSGNYSVTITIGSCIYNAIVNVDVKLSVPTPSASNNSPVCPGQTVTLNAATLGGSGVVYNWTGPGSFTASTTSNTVPVNNAQPANTGVYTVIATTTEGCSTDPATTVVTLYPKVTADFSSSVNELCGATDEVKFTDLSTGSSSNSWDFGDLTGGIGSPVTHSYPNKPIPPSTVTYYTIRLIATNAHCADTVKKTIGVGHPLKAAFSVDDDSICQHTPVNFTDLSLFTPATSLTELWDFKDGATSGTILSASHIYDRPGVYNATLVLTDYLGCKDSASHLIVVDSTGFIKFATSDDRVCLGGKISFKGDYMPLGLTSAGWDLGDGNLIPIVKNVDHSYDKPGTYNVVFSATYRICPPVSSSATIVIKPYPVINLGPDKTICPNGAPVALIDEVNASNPAATWKWNTEVLNTAAGILVYGPGVYAATVDIDGCKATDSVAITKNCYVDIPNVFTPNGDGNNDYFLPKELLSKGLAKFNMTIYNRWGGIVFKSENATGRGWDGKLNGEDQPTGVFVYLIEATFINGSSEKYQGNVTLLR